ncbi:MAG: nucleotide sugar dehydrogenase [Acidobacteriota bacterium]
MSDAATSSQRSRPAGSSRLVVCVQGLGFVGAAMATAVARARRAAEDEPAFDVIGVELDVPEGRRRAAAVDRGELPFRSVDAGLSAAIKLAHDAGNLTATVDPAAYARAEIVVVDVPLDVVDSEATTVRWPPFRAAIETLADRLRPGSLVLVETTVPPGTCERVVAPILEAGLARRGLAPGSILLAHSYERVMPGPGYLESLVRFWRVYAGRTTEAAARCRAFLETVIDTSEHPLTELPSTTASETAKLLENSYRAANIAFVDEWSAFAERAGLDLFEIVEAIRVRPTHANLRQPGLGVGGYCLPKDPLLVGVGASELLGVDAPFEMSRRAVEINHRMPQRVLELLEHAWARLSPGAGSEGADPSTLSFAGCRLLLLGVAYRPGVDDTRSSPSEPFARAAIQRGAEVVAHDPLVRHWRELGIDLDSQLPSPAEFDIVVLAVGHSEYRALDLGAWLGPARPLVFDAGGVATEEQRRALRQAGHRYVSVGRGDSVELGERAGGAPPSEASAMLDVSP